MHARSLCTAAMLALIFAGPVFAHAKLRSTDPAADAQLKTAPTSLSFIFNENVQLAVLTLTSAGKNIPVTLDRGAVAAAKVTIELPTLAAGTYEVRWSALSADDGHVTKGVFSFTIMGTAASTRP
jgi:copper resistance protein C